ncbi:hypothetical protein BLNAU_7972 [Blattamonas nauphoetae]|uniref:Uncharacterized protein n=1 Tax=Blattamonas nauphoetae TaxID=2049346 RepID=A0ABQ9Y064_9EUKA|nr:hypothetical protein BLNAU_7972 [Blattamonas nauphoetae]
MSLGDPPDLEDFEDITKEFYEQLQKEDADADKYLVIDTDSPFKALFPLCAQQHFLREQKLQLGPTMFEETERDIDQSIREICTEYGGEDDKIVALKKWRMLDVFPILASGNKSSSHVGRFHDYLEHLSEISMIVKLCESISEAIRRYDPEHPKAYQNFRYIGHLLSLVFHSCKRVSPKFCQEIQAHFDAFRDVWEHYTAPPNELLWLDSFIQSVLKSLFVMIPVHPIALPPNPPHPSLIDNTFPNVPPTNPIFQDPERVGMVNAKAVTIPQINMFETLVDAHTEEKDEAKHSEQNQTKILLGESGFMNPFRYIFSNTEFHYNMDRRSNQRL